MDFVLAGLSVLGAGLAFGTPAPFGTAARQDRVRVLLIRSAAVLLMLVPGFLVSDLFGPEGSTTALWRTAVALWLPGLVVALVLGRGDAESSP